MRRCNSWRTKRQSATTGSEVFPTISLQHPQQLLAKRSPRNRPKKRYALIPGNGTLWLFNSPRWPLRTDRATCFLLHRDHNVIRRHRASNFNPSARLKHHFLDRGNNKSRNNNAGSCKRGVTEITWGIRSNELWLHHRDFYPRVGVREPLIPSSIAGRDIVIYRCLLLFLVRYYES